MTSPTMISGLAEIADNYDALLCDVWGVMHNGKRAFAGVDAALQQFRANKGGKVLMLSNAPRPALNVQQRMDDVGNQRDSYDAILTSGDAARIMLAQYGREGKKCFHLGPEKDADLVVGLEIEFTPSEVADIVLLSGLYDDTSETPDDYADLLAQLKARDLPVICCNPDRMVQFGEQVIFCAGAVAELYENIGGKVIWVGKPHHLIYQQARKMLDAMGAGGRVLAIGDGAKTDMVGAQQAGLDALFIAGGLANAMAKASTDTQTQNTAQSAPQSAEHIAALLAQENTQARYAMRHLIW